MRRNTGTCMLRSALFVVTAIAVLGCSSQPAGRGGAAGGGDSEGDGSGTGGGTGGGDVAVRGLVKVTVVSPLDGRTPVSDAIVVFNDPDGSLVTQVRTDAAGHAEAEVLPGASVTTVNSHPNGVELSTTLGLAAGDDVILGGYQPSGSSAGRFTVSWTPVAATGTAYSVFGPCGYAGYVTDASSLTFSVGDSCNPDKMELVVKATGNTGAETYTTQVDVPFVDGGSVKMPDWSAGEILAASYTHLASISEIATARHVAGDAFVLTNQYASTNGRPAMTLGLLGPSGLGGQIETTVYNSSRDTQVFRQRLAPGTLNYSVDLASVLLPWTTDLQQTDRRFQVTKIAADVPGTAPALTELELHWARAGMSVAWRVFGGDIDTIQLPAMPASFGAAAMPTSSDRPEAAWTSIATDAFTDYDSVRGNIGAALRETRLGPHSRATLIRMSKSTTLNGGSGW